MGVLKEMRQKQLVAVPGPQGGTEEAVLLGGLGEKCRPSPSFRIQLRHHLFQEPFRTLSGAGGASLPRSLPHLALLHSSLQSSAGLRAPGGPASPLRVPRKAWWGAADLLPGMWMGETSPRHPAGGGAAALAQGLQ